MTASTSGANPRVVIVGAGQAGFQVAASLRELGFAGSILILGEESYLPYQRPPLSKTYLKDPAAPEKVYLRASAFFADKSIEVRTNAHVTAIDRPSRTLALSGGDTVHWDILVLATGVANRRLPGEGHDHHGVVTLRGLDDAHVIRDRLAATKRIVVIGGGVIGLEMSAFARGLGLEVDVVELGPRLCGRIGSAPLCDYFHHFHKALGTRVHLETGVARLEAEEGRITAAHLSTGERIPTDMVLVSIGVVPHTDLAAAAGLTVQDGIIVDDHMRTSDPNIFAVGDCTRFTPRFGPLHGIPGGQPATIRLESVQNAIDQGRTAAECIVGKPRPYDALPWFWSDQGSLKLQIAGLVFGHDRTIVKADETKGTMTVFCFAQDTLIGVECVNRPTDFVAARRALGARKIVRASDVEHPDFDLRKFM